MRAERGSGTYVEARRLAYPLRSRTRFSEIVGAGGREPRGQLIDASEAGATRELARELGATRALMVTDPGLEAVGHPQRALESLRESAEEM